MTDEEKIAAFLAKRGVTRVPAGQGTLVHMTGKDWARAVRHPQGLPGIEAEATNALIEQRIVRNRAVYNGLGEAIAPPEPRDLRDDLRDERELGHDD